MKWIERKLEKDIFQDLKANRVSLLIGARRVGKTELVRAIASKFTGNKLILNGDDINTHKLLADRSAINYNQLLHGIDLLIIDEAQMIPEIGLKLKFICDQVNGISIIATGSSAYDIQNRFGEPLTGRSRTYHLFPIAQIELKANENRLQTIEFLNDRLIFGCYPELLGLNSKTEKQAYLRELVSSYLLKDILSLEGIGILSKMHDLLKLIAFQTGKEVSIQELGNQLSMSKNTVDKYLQLLSKTFIIYKIGGFSRNLRKEVTKSNRWYFYDNGIRNALIPNFSPIDQRMDVGELWENYVLSERLKANSYNQVIYNSYFWRTYDQQEIDWIEERDGKLFAYEIKWNEHKVTRPPVAWVQAYPGSVFETIHPGNYLPWIT